MNSKKIIKSLYGSGWNRDLVKIFEKEGGIKVKGSLTRMNWGEMKFQLYVHGYSYNKAKKLFFKTHEARLIGRRK